MFLSKRRIRLAAVYLGALVLLYSGGSMFLSNAVEGGDENLAPTGSEVSEYAAYRNGDPESSNISLAINVDWGGEYLPDMLSILEKNDITATFFLTGRWCDSNAELARQLADAGHELGNHGYSHTSPNASSIEEIIDEITRTEQSIANATGQTTRLYAPPSGEEEPHVLDAAQQAGYYTVLWSVDTIDWQKPDAATLIDRVMSKIHGGAIILAHPTASTLEALPELIEQLKAEGYSFVSVSENLAL